ncbi:streptophobe family protein [Kitasatospora sp. NPDC002227]|uniref:streptophobe family protein n=1 Tax=Kitasatospora sp. NPDC002227 TaxID=3154773 RepID=UPI00331B46D3
MRSWADAVLTALGALLAMTAVAALALWAAHAGDLPEGAFPAVLAATVLTALGVPVDVTGSAAFVATARGGITVLPLTVTLVGALTAGVLFLRPLRLHAVVAPRELAARAARTALLWLVLTQLLRLPAHHDFTVSTGNELIDTLGGAFGAAPVVGFRVGAWPTAEYGLVWLLAVLLLALGVSRRSALPGVLVRHQGAVRPAGHAVLGLLLAYCGLGLLAGLVSMVVDGHPRETLAVLLLGLPNLAWLALGIGLGGSWHGHVDGALGLPMPPALAGVFRTSDTREVTLNLAALGQQDGRAWLLLPLAALALLLTGLAAARHSPGLRLWQYAVHLAAAFGVAMLLVCILTTLSAGFGLSLLGLGGTGGLALSPDLLTTVPLAALWGAAAGLAGGLLTGRRRAQGP